MVLGVKGQGHNRLSKSNFVNTISHEVLEQKSNLSESYINKHYLLLMTWLDFRGQTSRSQQAIKVIDVDDLLPCSFTYLLLPE